MKTLKFLIVGFPVTALLLRHAVPARPPAPAPAPAPLNARAGPQAAEPAQAPAEPQQTEQGRVLPGLGCARPRRAAAAPQSYPHSLGPAAPSAAAPSPAGAPRPTREAAPRGARPRATAAARRRRHLGTRYRQSPSRGKQFLLSQRQKGLKYLDSRESVKESRKHA